MQQEAVVLFPGNPHAHMPETPLAKGIRQSWEGPEGSVSAASHPESPGGG